ncbi:MAG: Na+/H+ antiporter NhaC family protein [Robiginitomaculum sp.]
MDPLGFLSLLPPALAVILALATRRVIPSLLAGLFLGYVLLAGGNPILGLKNTALALFEVFKDIGNRRIVIFTLLIGVLIMLTQKSGGVSGFVNYLLAAMDRQSAAGKVRRVQLLALLTGTLLFIESNISIMTVGAVYRPIFDQLKIPREKLAYISDTSCAPSCILFPFNAWGAYIAVQLSAQNVEQPFGMVLKSIAYNFYPMAALAIAFIIIVSRKDFGPMAKAERRARETGALLAPGARPMMDTAIGGAGENIKNPKMRNMLIPIGVMVALMPTILIATGWEAGGGALLGAIQKGSGSMAVLYACIGAIISALVLIAGQRLMGPRDIGASSLAAMRSMLPLAALMVLAFALGTMIRALGTGQFVADSLAPLMSPALIPALIFAVACLIAFGTGTSWGTFAIMIPFAVPLALGAGMPVALTVGAALGGGIFGDHCSPTSDTSIISSMASASDHIDHVRTQLPYALTGGVIAIALYIALGFFYA